VEQVEHRFVSRHLDELAGRPLTDYQVIVETIAGPRPRRG